MVDIGDLRGMPPQRYTVNREIYRQRGGSLRLEELYASFTAGNAHQGDIARFFFLCLAFDQIVKEGVEGDIAELGAYKGHTAAMLADFARRLGRTAYILDTFAGFAAEDVRGIDASASPAAFSDTSLEAVRALVGDDNVRFVKGHFPESATELPAKGRYALVHIDCDLYAPIRSALEYFYPRVVPGGFLIVHDYSSFCWDGAERAVDLFFADKPEAPLPLPDNGGSVAVRKVKSHNWLARRRTTLLARDWSPAGNDVLRDLLGEGWSVGEDWGVWGVGDRHEIFISLSAAAQIDFDVEAMPDKEGRRRVEVWTDRLIATWDFAPGSHRAVHSLRLPQGSTLLTFRPSPTGTPRELLGVSDDRPLGMALHRIRQR